LRALITRAGNEDRPKFDFGQDDTKKPKGGMPMPKGPPPVKKPMSFAPQDLRNGFGQFRPAAGPVLWHQTRAEIRNSPAPWVAYRADDDDNDSSLR